VYQASGIFAPLTMTELSSLDRRMLAAWHEADSVWPQNWALREDITDVRRDVNAEWGSR
jgi:hypothetical protein